MPPPSIGLPPLERKTGEDRFYALSPLEAPPCLGASSPSMLHRCAAPFLRGVRAGSLLPPLPALLRGPVVGLAAHASAPGSKRPRMASAAGEEGGESVGTKRVGTHSGTFHCDEALGCFLLRLTSKFKGAEVVRTRNQEILEGLEAVLDVGGEYDPARDRFDHHQRGFSDVFGHGFNTKLSSAGLVYKHYGQEVVAALMGLPVEHKDVQTVYLAVYKSFIEAVDAIDNGVNQYVSDAPPLYESNTHLGARVGRLNPGWLEEQSEEKQDAAFRKAMELAGEEFLESVKYTATSWLPGRSIVEESLGKAAEVHPTGEIVVLSRFCPWKQHLAELEKEMQIPAERLPKYVVYQDERGSQWRVQAVSVAPGSFQSRLPLPEKWRGLRDEELSQVSGIPGCVFAHISGFIGGNLTKEGALAMAKAALQDASQT